MASKLVVLCFDVVIAVCESVSTLWHSDVSHCKQRLVSDGNRLRTLAIVLGHYGGARAKEQRAGAGTAAWALCAVYSGGLD